MKKIDDHIRKYSAFKIRCQMELGERTAKMEKASYDRGNQYTGGKILDGNIAKKTDRVTAFGLTPSIPLSRFGARWSLENGLRRWKENEAKGTT